MKFKKCKHATTEEMSYEDEEKNTRTQIAKPKLNNLSNKRLSRNQINIFLCGLKCTAIPRLNNIELKTIIQNYTHKLRPAEFFQNKETNDSEETICFYPISKQE